ncbi:MAG: KTSC domain-containing protein [Stenotrophomonas sp.]|nr:KTSC domain-containing protein [Stenotrophomonas sp.]
MEMIKVRSSAIAEIGYEPATMRMRIRFVEGHTYDFCRVPAHVYQGFYQSASKGRYYNENIRDRYQC